MKTTIGAKGLKLSWQGEFPKTTECIHCGGKSRIGFVTHEGMSEDDSQVLLVCELHENKSGIKKGFWLHDRCAVAVYFCYDCLEATALWNQA